MRLEHTFWYLNFCLRMEYIHLQNTEYYPHYPVLILPTRIWVESGNYGSESIIK